MSEDLAKWVQSKHLGRYLLYCLLGPGAPMLLAILTIPRVIHQLGVERFGVLTLVWAVIGYFSLFDLGLGRAAIRLFAEKKGQNQSSELRTIVTTTLIATSALGIVGALFMAGLTPFLIHRGFNLDPVLARDASASFYVMALTIPFISLTGTLRGVLEVQQHFRLVNMIQIGLGVFTYLGPLISLQFFDGLLPIVIVLALTRIGTFLIFWQMAMPTLPQESALLFSRGILSRLIRMGGWLTVTNVVGPIIVYVDRFIIGSVLTLASVSYYTTTFEGVYRVNIFAGAVSQVLYPALSTLIGKDETQVIRLLRLGFLAISLVSFPLVAFITLLAPELMTLWLGAEFAEKSQMVLRLLATGLLLNMCAQVPLTLLQSAERPGWVAKLHLAEGALYVPALVWVVHHFGIQGVAALWMGRAVLDFVGLAALMTGVVPHIRSFLFRFMQLTSFAVGLLWACVQIAPLSYRILSGVLLVGAYTLASYWHLLDSSQRQQARSLLMRLQRRDLATKL